MTVSRRHSVITRGRRLHPPRRGQPQRHVREPPPGREREARGRRRGADRQVQAHLPGELRASHGDRPTSGRAAAHDRGGLQPPARRVPRHLDLEDPLPRRTRACSRRGGRRAATGSTRRRTSSGSRRSSASSATSSCRCGSSARSSRPARRAGASARGRRPAGSRGRGRPRHALRARRRRRGVRPRAGGVRARRAAGDDGDKRFPERDVDVAAACARLARYGVAPRNLATFRRWADNEADLLERIVAPELRSPNPEKRHAGLENLENLAALSQELSNLLFWRALRGIVPRS